MITVVSPAEVRRRAAEAHAQSLRVALVPTMGFLHQGHLALVRAARSACDVVVVSIFVNPTQFGPDEDLDRYPRDPEQDARLCRREGADLLFLPDAKDLYREGHSVFVEETRLSGALCGLARPGHFRGVATIVAKLFNLVRPDVAVFGLKDAQQARIVEQMVQDLNFDVQLLFAPIVREPDGLALSSRNAYLTPAERAWAPRIHAALDAARCAYAAGERDARRLCRLVRAGLEPLSASTIEYVEAVAWSTLRAVETVSDITVLAVAVRLGKTRLIDNLILGDSDVGIPCCRSERVDPAQL